MVELHYNTNRRTFSHLTPYDRGKILALRQQGKTLEAIAQVIGCHKSTISRELKRDTVTQKKSDLTEYQAYFPEAGQASTKKIVLIVGQNTS
jgi:transposase, IS30 family